MNPTVYIETSIVSYLAARPSRDVVVAGRQVTTRNWWDGRRPHYRLLVSQYVLDEAARGDAKVARARMALLEGIEVLRIDAAVIRLAKRIVSAGAIPPKAATDAGHIAVAARHEVNFLLTWNCTHIANAENLKRIGAILSHAGLESPTICTPDELCGGDGHED